MVTSTAHLILTNNSFESNYFGNVLKPSTETTKISNSALTYNPYFSSGALGVHYASSVTMSANKFARNFVNVTYSDGSAATLLYMCEQAVLTGNHFTQNNVYDLKYSSSSGSLRVSSCTQLNLSNNIFDSNKGIRGGALHTSDGTHCLMVNNTVRNNIASMGGAILIAKTNFFFSGNSFLNNSANQGASLFISGISSSFPCENHSKDLKRKKRLLGRKGQRTNLH